MPFIETEKANTQLTIYAATKKATESMAHAYPDRDFPATLPSVYHLPATDDPVNISAVVNRYDQLRCTDPAYPATLRAHAEAHLTWDAKMAPVKEWLSGRGAA